MAAAGENMMTENTGKSRRGFASMDRERQREIASKGGRSVPEEKRSFSRDRGLAAAAGRKGGQNVSPEDRSFSQNRELASHAGRKGGQSSQPLRSAGRSAGPDDMVKGPVVAGAESPLTEA
ncbi:stress-induced acidophilic repeat protein [Camelimonas lactis]|uniref:Stress-induced acidophilic repeat protein n=2 Tax=Camelimonas lactis TaxID=659006 RepID=A0A4R2GX86_9HYPH|nr:stress-induced acidophilic repeat protein [Camelimonas lactis]